LDVDLTVANLEGILDKVGEQFLEKIMHPSSHGSSSANSTAAAMPVVFESMSMLLNNLMALLPSAVVTMQDARSLVCTIAASMRSIFEVFAVHGPQIFTDIALAYKVLWIVYFVLLLPLTLGILWYGMWASGWMGGPSPDSYPEETEEEAARPKTCWERICTCWNACCLCCSRCHDSNFCFWSCVIIFQIIVLLIFIIAIVLCLLNGIKIFLNSACAQIYMLSQDGMCSNVLYSVKSFISTFTVDILVPLDVTCDQKSLLLCNLIYEKMVQSMIFTTIFSFASAIFQYQLIIESAILHERARMRRVVTQLMIERGMDPDKVGAIEPK
jgi:hypothetical protein